MKLIISKIVRLAFYEIVCIAYEIYSDVKMTIILTISEIVKTIVH